VAIVTGGNGGFNMIDPLGFGEMLLSFAVGTSTATQWTTETAGGRGRWVFTGTNFGAFQSGIPTTGTITGLVYSTPQGGTLATFSGINLTMETFFSFIANNQFQGLLASILSGDDQITGGTGNDNLLGYAGNDQINGGDGADTIDGGTGLDTLDGGAGADLLLLNISGVVNAVSINTTGITGGTFVDVGNGVQVRGFERINFASGAGADTLTIGHVVTGQNEWNAGAGLDTLIWDFSAQSTSGVQMVFTASDRGFFNAGGQFSVNMFNFERFQITAGAGADTLNGLGGADTLNGGGGNDEITGAGGDDVMIGGAGDDRLQDGQGMNSSGGVGGNDLLDGGDGADLIFGADGNNTLNGGAGDDFIYSGQHLQNGSGVSPVDVIDGGSGVDVLALDRRTATAAFSFDAAAMASATGQTLADGTIIRNIESLAQAWLGTGDDTITVTTALLTSSTIPATLSLFFDGGAGQDLFIGNFAGISSPVSLNGSLLQVSQPINRFVSIFVERFNVTGTDGNDTLISGSGNDTLIGGVGNDSLDGGSGADILEGGAGDDILVGSAGDTLNGGDGLDLLRLDLSGGSTAVTLDLSSGGIGGGVGGIQATNIELIDARLGSGDDVVILGQGSFQSGGFNQQVNAGGGFDILRANLSAIGDQITLSQSTIQRALPGLGPVQIFLSAFERFDIIGGANADSLTGLQGADTLNGGGGNDFISGNGGADSLSGGAGDDWLNGQIGSSFDGGSGQDHVQVYGVSTGPGFNLRLSDFGTSTGVTLGGGVIRNVESIAIDGGAGDDVFIVDRVLVTQQGRFNGGEGIDRFIGDFSYTFSSVNFWVSGGMSVQDPSTFGEAARIEVFAEEVWLTTGSGIDGLTGGDHADWFRTGAGDDRLLGGGGNDTLEGGSGADAIDGGAGFDILDYSGSNAGVTVNLERVVTSQGLRQQASGGHANGDSVLNMEGVFGTIHADSITGNGDANLIRAAAGDDQVVGWFGDDTLDGGAGFDTALFGTALSNIGVLAAAGGGYVAVSAEGRDMLNGFERIQTSAGGMRLGGSELVDRKFGDFNGDGRADVALRSETGSLRIWTMSGGVVQSDNALPTISLGWRMVGEGDFNGDGKDDFLWRNVNGETAIWLLDGPTAPLLAGSGTLPTAIGTEWTIQDTADFDGDGKDDVLWRRDDGLIGIWRMNGPNVAGVGIPAAVGEEWRVAGTGDTDGDGKADIVWRNQNTGDVFVWRMNGVGFASSGTGFVTGVGLDWSVAAVADLDGDAKADLVWRNNVTGAVHGWLMNGSAIASAGYIGAADLGWHIVGAGDFNGDARADLMWARADGTTAVWTLSGLTQTSATLTPGLGANWHVL
jgi:Ca2+-binding RTX toxin-like protein